MPQNQDIKQFIKKGARKNPYTQTLELKNRDRSPPRANPQLNQSSRYGPNGSYLAQLNKGKNKDDFIVTPHSRHSSNAKLRKKLDTTRSISDKMFK